MVIKNGLVVVCVLTCMVVFGACAMPTRPFSSPTSSTQGDTVKPPVPTYKEAPTIISRESDRTEVHVNLVKFVGAVSSANTTVTVNDVPATVNPGGSYYALLDLVVGENAIQVQTRQGTDVISYVITVHFVPPLAVFLDMPHIDQDVDYRRRLLKVSGRVSDPMATVTVNSKPVTLAADGTISNPNATLNVSTVVVEKDGTFPAQIHPGYVQAVARLREQVDTDWWQLLLTADGAVATAPGQSGMRSTSGELSADDVTMTGGETASVAFRLRVRKDVARRGPVPVACRISAAQLEEDAPLTGSEGRIGPTVPIAPGLVIEAEPTGFMVYPNVDYSPIIRVKATPDLAPGTYRLQIVITGPITVFAPLTVHVRPRERSSTQPSHASRL